MKSNLNIQIRGRGVARAKTAAKAFTLIGLLVVIGVSALLAAMMLPMLTRAKAASQTTQCMNGMKQMGLGIETFADHHNQHYPAAAMEDCNPATVDGGPMSWDVWIDRYIGGNRDMSQLGNFGGNTASPSAVPKILRCPADTGTNTEWAAGLDATMQRRSYSMNAASPNPSQIPNASTPGQNCAPPYYPALPPVPQQGIGIWWQSPDHTVDWNTPGYPTRIIQDASGTILLAENADGDNLAGNGWYSMCSGPTNSCSGIYGDFMFQLDAGDPYCYGSTVYAAHGNKFNYLFHDNHVSTLTWQQTVGMTASSVIYSSDPNVRLWLGMWSIRPGD